MTISEYRMYNKAFSQLDEALKKNTAITKKNQDGIALFYELNKKQLEKAYELIFGKQLKPNLLDIKKFSRKQDITDMRHLFMYFCRRAGFQFGVIGKFLNGRDHSTAVHGDNKITEFLFIHKIPESEIKINGLKDDDFIIILNQMCKSTSFFTLRKYVRNEHWKQRKEFDRFWHDSGLDKYEHLLGFIEKSYNAKA